MRILGPVTEDEIVACYLRAEIDSGRYGEKLRQLLERDDVDPDVLARPDLADPDANSYRRALLDEHRGYDSRTGLFGGFPAFVEWHRAAFTPDDVLSILYIDWDWWVTVSGGTRQPVVAAERIRRGDIAGTTVEEHAVFVEPLRSSLSPPELITVSRPDHSRIVVVEGHVRLTAYALYPELLPEELELYLGVAEDIDDWPSF
jgi:hypothetical protein